MARPKSQGAIIFPVSRSSRSTAETPTQHDSPESIAKYAVLISMYQQGGLNLPEDFDISMLDAKASILLAPNHCTFKAGRWTNFGSPCNGQLPRATSKPSTPITLHAARLKLLCDEVDDHDGDKIADSYRPVHCKHSGRDAWPWKVASLLQSLDERSYHAFQVRCQPRASYKTSFQYAGLASLQLDHGRSFPHDSVRN